MNPNQDKSQEIGRQFFLQKDDKSYRKYFSVFSEVAYNTAYSILKDHEHAGHVMSLLMTQMWTSRDKFEFDDTKSHSGYIHQCAMNKARVHLRSAKKSKLVYEPEGDDTDENSYYDNLFYNGGRQAVPEKVTKAKLIFGDVEIGTKVYSKGNGVGTVIGTTDAEVVVEFAVTPKGLTDQLTDANVTTAIGPDGEEVITDGNDGLKLLNKGDIMLYREHNGVTYLTNVDNFGEITPMSLSHNMIINKDNADFVGINEKPEKLSDIIEADADEFYEMVKDTLRNNMDNGLLYDAMVVRVPYAELAVKYKLDTPGAVKTRVFRIKKRLGEMMESRQILTRLQNGERYTGSLSYYNDAAMLLYKVEYKNGLLDGKFYAFHENAQSSVRVDTTFERGMLVGKYREYDTDNKIVISGSFVNNREHGTFQYWKDNIIQKTIKWVDGQALLVEEYENGAKISADIAENDEHPIQLLTFEKALYGRKERKAS